MDTHQIQHILYDVEHQCEVIRFNTMEECHNFDTDSLPSGAYIFYPCLLGFSIVEIKLRKDNSPLQIVIEEDNLCNDVMGFDCDEGLSGEEYNRVWYAVHERFGPDSSAIFSKYIDATDDCFYSTIDGKKLWRKLSAPSHQSTEG